MPSFDQLREQFFVLVRGPEIPNRLSAEQSQLLLSFAWAASMEAVRRLEPNLSLEGLRALAVEDGQWDDRDSQVRMAALHHSAVLLRQDPSAVFGQAANEARSLRFGSLLREFPGRPDYLKSLSAFESHISDRDGFTYSFLIPDE